jgi:isopentenyl phosphate kinase
MKPLYIIKIGGSVATHKNRLGVSVRKKLLREIAEAIAETKKKKDFDMILIHGAGAAGHQLAHKYDLKNGVRDNQEKWQGAFESRLVNQRLNNAIAKIFNSAGLRITPAHTASVIIQENKKIAHCNLQLIKEALRWNCIPLLYGEMVFDTKLGMSICSGDAIAPYLAEKLTVNKIFFATDVDGIFDRDPHMHKNASLLKEIDLMNIKKNAKLTKSHNVDVTGGLEGKIASLNSDSANSLRVVEIFNGLLSENFKRAISGENFAHTKIRFNGQLLLVNIYK